jgi:CheY-like chemotaxis protein
MSHELRTPLNSVIALSGVLGRKLKGAIPAQEYSWLEVIERNGKNLLELINDILDLSRIESGKEELACEDFSPVPIVADVLEMLEAQAREKNILLVDSLAPDAPRVTGDAWKFRHILQNIVGNAVKFTDSGSVTVSSSLSPEGLRLSVGDTGIGIAKEHLPFIFDEFRQADESTSRKYGGSGLGLAIARKYARLMGGDIEVQSVRGAGSSFTVILPLAEGSKEAVQGISTKDSGHGSKPASIADKPADEIRLLLVEDSEPAIVQMMDILDGRGYSVSVARDGRQALEMIGLSLPDAMVLDLMMPEVDGFEVLRSVRSREETRQLPVLILTARHVTKEELSFLKGNHIGQLIQKGDIGREELLSAIRRLILPGTIPSAPRALRSRVDGKALVLVVEDNADNLTTVRALLDQRHEILEAMDGAEALARARESKPDLILMDISLPSMDGYAVLDSLRADESLRDTPVLALTAKAMKGDREEILGRGFDGYISKPIDAKAFVLTLSEFLHEA